jgi:F-type H+-transporting ATPase subunit alpha
MVAYDKLNNHAVSFRQMALLARNAPGRDAFPGDMFYQHARLLERAAQLCKNFGNGSLSAFPLFETQLDNITAYICTNLISITDGQLYLAFKLFQRGIKPAVDLFKSVSRVGTKAQAPLLT